MAPDLSYEMGGSWRKKCEGCRYDRKKLSANRWGLRLPVARTEVSVAFNYGLLVDTVHAMPFLVSRNCIVPRFVRVAHVVSPQGPRQNTQFLGSHAFATERGMLSMTAPWVRRTRPRWSTCPRRIVFGYWLGVPMHRYVSW